MNKKMKQYPINEKIEWISKTRAGVLSFAYYESLFSLLRVMTPFEIDNPISGGLLAVTIAVSFYPTKEILTIILNRALGFQINNISHERPHISFDLHDTVLQNLHRAQTDLKHLPNHINKEMVAVDLQKAITETRAICLNLNVQYSRLLEPFPLLVSTKLPNLNTTCIVNNPQTIQLSQKVEKNIYCIIQEALSIFTYSTQAERAEVRLDVLTNRIHLFIQAEDVGFDPSTVKEEQLGLTFICNVYMWQN